LAFYSIPVRSSIPQILFITIFSIFALGFNSPFNLYGQPIDSTSDRTQEIEDSLIELYPGVTVEFVGNSTVVLMGDEKFLVGAEGTMNSFWTGIDKVKQFGYTLDEITTSGMGSEPNPTRFYAILSLQNTTSN